MLKQAKIVLKTQQLFAHIKNPLQDKQLDGVETNIM
jgi:hypothetical protein